MTKYSSDSARLFRQPTSAERAQGKTMRIEPPYSQSVMWWVRYSVWLGLSAIIAVVLLVILLAFLT